MKPYSILIMLLAVFTMNCKEPEETPPCDLWVAPVGLSPNPAAVGTRVTLHVGIAEDPDESTIEFLWTGIGPKGSVQFENGINNEARVFFTPDTAGIYDFNVRVNCDKDTMTSGPFHLTVF